MDYGTCLATQHQDRCRKSKCLTAYVLFYTISRRREMATFIVSALGSSVSPDPSHWSPVAVSGRP